MNRPLWRKWVYLAGVYFLVALFVQVFVVVVAVAVANALGVPVAVSAVARKSADNLPFDDLVLSCVAAGACFFVPS